MTSDRGRDLVQRVRAGRALGVVVVEDPAAVAAEIAQDDGVVLVDAAELPAAVAAAGIRVAQLLVDRARRAEERALVEPGPAAGPEDPDDDPEADRQAVRFALVILLLALPAGVAVHLADGLLLAPALPAAALLALGVVVLVHRRPAPALPVAAPVRSPGATSVVEAAPSVRAAQAHLRRQEARWKVSWWERDLAVPDLDGWSVPAAEAVPITLVAVDDGAEVDERSLATMTATAPAAVRVVVLRSG